ncbi:MAG: DUF998 domain-containing protein [Streptosporangiales bacterium]|nr:DUF998 domain-containing protein [Streptosporangiales bacterium]
MFTMACVAERLVHHPRGADRRGRGPAARCVARRRMTAVGLVLVVLTSLSTAATGLFPLNVSMVAHSIASLPQFPVQDLGMLLLGVVWWQDNRGAAVLSLLCGLVGLVGLVLFVGATPWGLGLGGMERLALYPETVWSAVVGVFVLWRCRARAGVAH